LGKKTSIYSYPLIINPTHFLYYRHTLSGSYEMEISLDKEKIANAIRRRYINKLFVSRYRQEMESSLKKLLWSITQNDNHES